MLGKHFLKTERTSKMKVISTELKKKKKFFPIPSF